MKLILALTLIVLLAPTALAGPACTCDPHPAIEILKCVLRGGDACPDAIDGLDLPHLEDVIP